MIDWLVVFVASTVFFLFFRQLQIVDTAKKLGELMQHSLKTVSNPTISDIDKEKQLQALSITLFRHLFVMIAKITTCLLSVSTVFYLSSLLKIGTFTKQIDIVGSLPFLIASTVFYSAWLIFRQSGSK